MLTIKKQITHFLLLAFFYLSGCGSQDDKTLLIGDWGQYLTFEKERFVGRSFVLEALSSDYLYAVIDQGEYSVDGSLIVRTVSNVTVTPLKMNAAFDLNFEKACGIEDWSIDKSVDVTHCVGSSLFINGNRTLTDLYSVEDNMLRIGDLELMRR